MENITIYERDISYIQSTEGLDNTVYVPGYAVTGPVNTPTLCYSLSEFQNIFGIVPYTFENNQEYKTLSGFGLTTGNFKMKNEQELSYIYACELLNQGLPVLFERVMKDEKITKFTYSANIDNAGHLQINAKYPGRYGNSIKYKLENGDNNTYKLVVTQSAQYNSNLKDSKSNHIPITYMTSDIPTTIEFSTDVASDKYFGNLQTDIIEFVWDNNTIGTITSVAEFTALGNSTITDTDYEFEVIDLYNKMGGEYNTKTKKYSEGYLFTKLQDKGEYDIKYITAGGYPVFDYSDNIITKIMLHTAGVRGNSVAIIDYLNNIGENKKYKKLEGMSRADNSLQYAVNQNLSGTGEEWFVILDSSRKEDIRTYGTMFVPYIQYLSQVYNKNYVMASSFDYLMCVATSLKNKNSKWYAIAGVQRGIAPNVKGLSTNVTGAISSALELKDGISINPITNIKPYGYTIWNDMTLRNNNSTEGFVATSLLSVRCLACDVKSVVWKAARKFMFEPMSDILWVNFKSEIEPTIDKMQSGNVLRKYEIKRISTTEKSKIKALIRLYVIGPIKSFDITLEMSDSYVDVE